MINISSAEISAIKPNESYNYCIPNYSNVRIIDLEDYISNRFTINATFKDDGRYYISQNVNNISEKDVIIELINNEKFFGVEENVSRNKIIEKITVKHQNNFFDYYA